MGISDLQTFQFCLWSLTNSVFHSIHYSPCESIFKTNTSQYSIYNPQPLSPKPRILTYYHREHDQPSLQPQFSKCTLILVKTKHPVKHPTNDNLLFSNPSPVDKITHSSNIQQIDKVNSTISYLLQSYLSAYLNLKA